MNKREKTSAQTKSPGQNATGFGPEVLGKKRSRGPKSFLSSQRRKADLQGPNGKKGGASIDGRINPRRLGQRSQTTVASTGEAD